LTERLKPHIWFTLYTLMRLGAAKTPVRVSTTELSRVMGGSQQSASRHLQMLEKAGLIQRSVEPGGSRIRVTGTGLAELDLLLQELKWHLEGEEADAVELEGTVVSGLFEGAYYISKEGYRSQIEGKLGFNPFPGTLNLRIDEEDYEKKRRLERLPSIRLEGFKDGERSFGACRCYPLTVNGEVDGALIVAERSIHDYNILEVVAPVYLRRHLGLADGDRVRLSFLPLRRSVS
jgi:riboflavin kinase, archaea type